MQFEQSKEDQMRQNIYELFAQYEPQFQYRWNEIISSGFDSFTDELVKIAEGFQVTQSTEGQRVFWRNDEANVEAMFAYMIDPADLDSIISMYKDIKEMRVPVTYAIIEQREDGAGQYDIFRLSEKSYLEHCNRAWTKGDSCDE